MKDLVKKIKPHQWMTCYGQIISRICHPHASAKQGLQDIIVKILSAHIRQGMWQIMSLKFHSSAERQERYNIIKQEVISKDTGKVIKSLFNEAESLCGDLICICDHKVSETKKTFELSSLDQKEIINKKFKLIIPSLSQLTPIIPEDNPDHFKSFSDTPVTINGFNSKVELLSSLVRPKKITMNGSDGEKYIYLCKPKDDLRKDSRMGEYYTMLNKLLKKDPESRQRHLKIRTYSVIPLNVESGLIEWVNNTCGYKPILQSLYTQIGKNFKSESLACKNLYEKNEKKFTTKDMKKLWKDFPPVFHRWFTQSFPEPSAWLRTRTAYSRTLAVMSMVGYIVGLGDRHGENILFDASTGDTVHVDFNCLFFKGLTFPKPEKVPFRLTPNMVNALGLTGYEGSFRRVCEITLKILRKHKDTLMSVLETFIHDPTIEPPPSNTKSKNKSNDPAEHTRVLRDIGDRLDGKMRTILNPDRLLLPLSVEGHVQVLIQEATKVENLAAMFIGWAPYL
eukprot:TRINITY_DN681_c0_g3_i3.p1 TRINITY_DN681_c0_g3~~TRINITY_DN681_c0_g3_i3.p1  ORF type:complete len:508 (+),score=60.48 TRINITY_DN681_c0_g3_i3:152-1675(+)